MVTRGKVCVALEPRLGKHKLLTLLGAGVVDQHLFGVVRLHVGMSFGYVTPERHCSLKSDTTMSAFESQGWDLLFDGFWLPLLYGLGLFGNSSLGRLPLGLRRFVFGDSLGASKGLSMFGLFVIFLRYNCLLRSNFIWLTLFLNPNLKLLNWELLRELIQALWLLSETLDLLGRSSSGAKFFQKLVELKGGVRRAVKT